MPEEDTIPLSISVEDAFKLLISGGVVEPGEKQSQFSFRRRVRNAGQQERITLPGEINEKDEDGKKSVS